MDHKKVVSIRLNGKETPFRLNVRGHQFDNLTKNMRSSTTEEIAAAKKDHQFANYFSKNEDNEDGKIVDLGSKRQEKINHSLPYWDDGNRTRSPKLPFGRRKKFSKHFTPKLIFHSLIFSIIMAVIVGVAFGIIMLKMITSNDTSSIADNHHEATNQMEVDSLPASVHEEEVLHPIPEIQYFVIQEGAYSTIDSAKEAAEALRQENFPAAIAENSEYNFLFMGISASKENAEALARHFETWNKEPYLKTYEINRNVKVNDMWNAFLQRGTKWMEKAATISSEQLLGRSIEEKDIQEMIQLAANWKESYAVLQQESSHEQLLQEGESWVKSLDLIQQTVQDKGVSDDVAWELQQAVLQAMIQYEQLVETFANDSQ